MILKMNLLYLVEHKITAHQYIILKMLSLNKSKELISYLKHTDTWNNIIEEIEKLDKLGFIEYYPRDIFSIKRVVLNDKFATTHGFNFDGFSELYNEFPVKVVRPDNKEEYLRLERGEARRLYNHIVDNDKHKHRQLMTALKNELEDRERKNTMMYMRKLKNWLANGEWEKYADSSDAAELSSQTVKYGEDIE